MAVILLHFVVCVTLAIVFRWCHVEIGKDMVMRPGNRGLGGVMSLRPRGCGVCLCAPIWTRYKDTNSLKLGPKPAGFTIYRQRSIATSLTLMLE